LDHLADSGFSSVILLTGYEGDKVRELIFIEDFVRILLDLRANPENDIVNIGAGEEFTIRPFARLLRRY
ncbi:MAG: hypothetical protein ABSH41_32655, partial [Syntrophobacteraceae bacterium]